MEDEICKKFKLELPPKEAYEEFNQSLLDEIYKGLEPQDTLGKIRKCCEYLRHPVPEFKSENERKFFHVLIELEYLNQASGSGR